MKNRGVLLILLLFSGYGCTATPELPTAVPTITLPTVTPSRISTPSPLPTLPATSTAIPPATAVPEPSASPVPTAVSPRQVAIPEAYSFLDAGSEWEIVIHDSPQLALQQGDVDAALTLNGAGDLIWQTPIALTVPWTTAWETVSWEEAQALLKSPAEQITIMPWQEMTPRFKALRINGRSPTDPNYPLQTRLTLSHSPGIDTQSLKDALQNSFPQSPTVHIAAVGDLMLSRRLGTAIQNGDIDFPFANVASHLQQAELTIGNVESAIGSGGVPEAKSYPFLAPPETAVSIAKAGFDVVSLANNHGMDFGAAALLDAITLFQQQGIATIGAGANAAQAHAPFITEINGLTLALLAYVHVPVENSGFNTRIWSATDQPGLAWGDPETVAADVTAVSTQVDIVIVVLHSGYEYVPNPSPPQVAASHAAIDAGADLVIGHHAHILQGVEFYKEGVIAYGLGNFAFDIDGAPETAVLDVWLDQTGVRELRFSPAIVQNGGQPRFATENEGTEILDSIYFLTNLLNP